MTRIDFYQIESNEPAANFTCRLIDKIYHLGHRIYVHVDDTSMVDELDELLWSFRPDRFIPHCRLNTDTAPIHIGCDKIDNIEASLPCDDVLVNLSGTVPLFFSRFTRVAEVVPLDQNSRDAARQNYRFYNDRGYPLQYHKMQERTV